MLLFFFLKTWLYESDSYSSIRILSLSAVNKAKFLIDRTKSTKSSKCYSPMFISTIPLRSIAVTPLLPEKNEQITKMYHMIKTRQKFWRWKRRHLFNTKIGIYRKHSKILQSHKQKEIKIREHLLLVLGKRNWSVVPKPMLWKFYRAMRNLFSYLPGYQNLLRQILKSTGY